MKGSSVKDEFAQKMYLTVTQSAANTLTFSQAVNLGVGLMNSMAIVIHEIKWVIPYAVMSELTANQDRFTIGLVGDNSLTDLTLDQPAVYDLFNMEAFVATAAGFAFTDQYPKSNLTNLPGGGLIVPADRVYLGFTSGGFAAAQTAGALVYFTLKPLKAEQYLELAQALRVFT